VNCLPLSVNTSSGTPNRPSASPKAKAVSFGEAPPARLMPPAPAVRSPTATRFQPLLGRQRARRLAHGRQPAARGTHRLAASERVPAGRSGHHGGPDPAARRSRACPDLPEADSLLRRSLTVPHERAGRRRGCHQDRGTWRLLPNSRANDPSMINVSSGGVRSRHHLPMTAPYDHGVLGPCQARGLDGR
jgi:hypothetical protein